MITEMEGKPIDIDRGNLNTGSTVHIFNYLDDNWKAAVVQEIDLTEREILVDYEDGTQEWIGVDGRKICFPPTEQPIIPLTPVTTKRRASSSKVDTENPTHVKKSKSSTSRIADTHVKKIKSDSLGKNVAKKIKSDSTGVVNKVKQNLRKSVPKSNLKNLNKTDLDKKDMSRPISAFMRLQFKSNHKTSKAHGKFDMKKQKRIRQEQFRPQNLETDSVNESAAAEQLVFETIIKRGQSRTAQPRSKDSKKEVPKLKIRIGKNNERITEQSDFSCERVAGGTPELSKKKLATKREFSASDTSVQSNERIEASFTVFGEKKIKTLFPKRSAPEPLLKPATSPLCPVTPESPSGLSSSLSSIYPTANVLPLALTAGSSGFYCPKQDCKKPCRNENMLMMHIKHYHREYRDMFSSMPNVADLAYKRTVGEHIESPQAGFLERITKLEEDRLKEKSADDMPMISQTEILDNTTDEKSTTVIENPEKMTDLLSKSNVKHACKKPPPNKRLSSSGSAPSSPKLSVLVAQLQEPPLLPPSISIQSEYTDAEFSVSQNKPVPVYSPQLSDQSNSLKGNSSPPIDSDEKQGDSKKSSPTKKRRLSQLDSTDVINCLCGYGLEDGLMIQCDLCQCWQHGACMSFENENDVPSNYVCETCQFPRRHHSSRKYCYVQNWLKEGRLANFQFSHPREEAAQKREQFLKQSHEFLCSLTELKYAVRSLQVKIQILRQTPDHPKLYLWAKSWNNDVSVEKENQSAMIGGPIPEDAINMADCRKHLSEHIEEEMKKAELMLRNIEEKIEKLDELDTDDGDEDGDFCNNPEKYTSVAKQTLLMMQRDLMAIHTLKYC